MECRCGGNTTVADTRKYMGTVYRKRRCLVCGNLFWTVENEAVPEEIKDLTHHLYTEKMDRKKAKSER